MRILLAVLITTLLLSACAQTAPAAEQPATLSSDALLDQETPVSSPGNAQPTNEPTAPAAPPLPTPASTPTAESAPARYPDLSLTQNFYPALKEYFGEAWSAVDLRGADYDPARGRIALSGCAYVCSADMGGYAYLLLLDATQGVPPQKLAIDTAVRIGDTDFTPDGEGLLYSTLNGIMKYDLASNTSSLFYKTPGTRLPSNDISPDGTLLASDIGGTMVILRLADLQEVARFEGIFTYYYHATYFNQTGDRVVFAQDQNQRNFAVYDITSQSMVREVETPEASMAALSPDGQTLALGSRETGVISLIDLGSGETIRQISPVLEAIRALSYSPADGLLFAAGFADDTSSMFDGIRYFDTQTGEDKGGLLTYNDYYAFKFAPDGTSLVTVGGYAPELWSPETEMQRRVGDLVREYFDAIVRADYQQAAQQSRPDDLTVAELEDLGFDPDDLVAAFTAMCVPDEVPCLPLDEIAAVQAADGEYWDYEVLVTLKNPDGSTLLFDGIEPYEYMMVKADAQGNLFITSLHPGMRYPFP